MIQTKNKYHLNKNNIQPCVLWFTGLSGAGKSTLAEHIYSILKEADLKVEHLDGDKVREIFPQTGFSKEDRDKHIKRVGFLASMLEKNGIIVIASFISPYKESQRICSKFCSDYKEIFVSTPIDECESRDVKGLYAKARKGEITQFTGIDDPYEIPENPEVIVDTSDKTVEESVQIILKELGFLSQL